MQTEATFQMIKLPIQQYEGPKIPVKNDQTSPWFVMSWLKAITKKQGWDNILENKLKEFIETIQRKQQKKANNMV